MNRIKEVLEKKGVKQVWLRDQLGKSYSIINGYLLNRSQTSIKMIHNESKILSINSLKFVLSKINSNEIENV